MIMSRLLLRRVSGLLTTPVYSPHRGADDLMPSDLKNGGPRYLGLLISFRRFFNPPCQFLDFFSLINDFERQDVFVRPAQLLLKRFDERGEFIRVALHLFEV